MIKQYGFAIIGCGAIADFHARAISQVEDAKLVAVYDANSEIALSFAAKKIQTYLYPMQKTAGFPTL